jgi:hypothetical protein
MRSGLLLLLGLSFALTAAALAGCVDGTTPQCGPDASCGYDFADSPYVPVEGGGGGDGGAKDSPSDSLLDVPLDVPLDLGLGG